MLTIVNITPGVPRECDSTYEVRINNVFIVSFTHCRQHGLARCLRDAAFAVEKDQMARERGKLQTLSNGNSR